MNSCEFVSIITALACGIRTCSSADETAQLAILFSGLGNALSTIIAQEKLYQIASEPPGPTQRSNEQEEAAFAEEAATVPAGEEIGGF